MAYLFVCIFIPQIEVLVSRNQGKIAPCIAPSRACAWFENKRFDWPSVSFSFATLLSINLISSSCTNFVFLHCLGLIDMLSAHQHGEIFACILLTSKLCRKTAGNSTEKLVFSFLPWWTELTIKNSIIYFKQAIVFFSFSLKLFFY